MTINKKSYYMPIFLIVIMLGGCEKKPYSPPRETKEETKARYDKLLSCKPDKPLSKGELYEKAMVQYWQRRTHGAFGADYAAYEIEMEKPKMYRNKLTGSEYKFKCGLTYHQDGTPDKVTRDACYPYQVHQFDNLEDFYFGEDKRFRNKNLNDFIANNKAQVYRWDKQPPIYTKEHYNKDVDFMVRHNVYGLSIYPKDCCKLLSYDEFLEQEEKIIKEQKVVERKKLIFNFSGWDERLVSKKDLSNYHFLSIKTVDMMFHNQNIDETYFLYPVTHCGKIL